jgi:hypothetical protein
MLAHLPQVEIPARCCSQCGAEGMFLGKMKNAVSCFVRNCVSLSCLVYPCILWKISCMLYWRHVRGVFKKWNITYNLRWKKSWVGWSFWHGNCMHCNNSFWEILVPPSRQLFQCIDDDYSGDYIRKVEMGGTRNTHWRYKKCLHCF